MLFSTERTKKCYHFVHLFSCSSDYWSIYLSVCDPIILGIVTFRESNISDLNCRWFDHNIYLEQSVWEKTGKKHFKNYCYLFTYDGELDVWSVINE